MALSIGNAVIIDDFVLLMGGANTRIGNFVHIACHCSIVGGGEFDMQDFAGLSGGVRIYTGSEDYSGNFLTNRTLPGAKAFLCAPTKTCHYRGQQRYLAGSHYRRRCCYRGQLVGDREL